jgi:branched-chain amino acid transport system substrate-binding protein
MEHRDTYPQAPNALAARRRKFVAMAALALLAGCKVIPKGAPDVTPPPPPPVEPSPDVLPTDTERHRVALLVPMTGANSAVGQAIANAATMALLDTNAQNLRVTTYDTTAGAAAAEPRRATSTSWAAFPASQCCAR